MINWNNIANANANASSNNNFFPKQNNNIHNIEISRVFIKKAFWNSQKTNILLQVGNDVGVFLDARFVKTDNYTLNANVGICENFEYTLVKIGDTTKNNSVRINGKQLIELINNFKAELEK